MARSTKRALADCAMKQKFDHINSVQMQYANKLAMAHQAVVGYENYVYCHDCGVIKSQLSGNIIKPKKGRYHFFDGRKIVGIDKENVYIYDKPSNSRWLVASMIVLIILSWTSLVITICLNSRRD